MAQNIDAVLAKLKELQGVIPGVEANIGRLQTLMKSAFGSESAGAALAITTELQNLQAAAEKAIATLGSTGEATAAMKALSESIAQVKTELATLNAPHMPGAATSDQGALEMQQQRIAFEKEYQALVAEGTAEPKAKAEAIAREQDAKVMQEQIALQERLNSAVAKPPPAPAGSGFKSGNMAVLDEDRKVMAEINAEMQQMSTDTATGLNASAENYALLEKQIASEQAAQNGLLAEQIQLQNVATTAEEQAAAATKARSVALNDVVMKMRESYGVGESGQVFTKSELTKNLAATAGGTRNLRTLTGGEDAESYFSRMLNSGEVVQANAYHYKFTELNTRDIDEFIARAKELGLTSEDTAKKLDEMRAASRLNAPGQQPAAKVTQEELNIKALQEGGVRSLFGSDEQFGKFQDRLDQLKLSMGDVKRATTDVASGMTTLNFETMDESLGVMKTATLYVDEFGRVITQNTARVRSFEDMITGNIEKVMTWVVAMGLVYGAMQKIGEAVTKMKEVQDKMVDIGITTKATADQMDSLYQSVYAVSQATSTDLAGALTTVNQALRATGGSSNDLERTATAVKLLSDSMILAKLSGMETKTAMDTLIAALRQLDQPLTAGGELLDKFQAVANQANTTMDDMSTTFAITAGAASDAGVKVNDLVALIGAFSEATSLTATETGNALRAMFSNFAQPKAVETLQKYGIAVQDVNGEFKSFIDVFQQASDMARSGVLSERQVAEIANALGGGSRRQAQVTALLTVAPRQVELKNFLDQGQAAGAAQEALSQKTSTLSSAMERLQNSFDDFAKTLGTSGGVLDFLTQAVNLLSTMLQLVTKLTSALGPGLPLLLGGAALISVMRSQGPALGRFGGMLGSAIGSPFGNVTSFGKPTYAEAQSALGMEGPIQQGAFRESELGSQFGRNAFNAMLPLIPLMAGSISQSAQSGEWTSTVGMGVGGAFMGIISGNPIWAMVGALIGKGIGDEIENQRKSAAAATAAQQSTPTVVPEQATSKEITASIERSRSILEDLSRADQNLGGRRENTIAERLLGVGADEALKQATDEYMRLQQGGLSKTAAYQQMLNTAAPIPGHPDFTYGTGTGGATAGFSQATLERAQQEMGLTDALMKAVDAIQNMPEEFQTALKNAPFLTTKNAFIGTAQGIQSATGTGELINTPDYVYNRAARYRFTQQLASGDLSTADYKSRMESLGSSGLGASLVVSSMHPTIDTQSVSNYKDEWLKVKDALTIADAGTQTYIQSVATNLTNLNQEMEKLKLQEEAYKSGLSNLDTKGFQDLETKIADVGTQSDIARAQIEALLKAIEDTNNASKFTFKGFGDYSKYTNDEMTKLVAQAKGLQEIYARQTNTPLDQLTKTAPDIVAMTKEGFSTWGGVYEQFLQQVLSDVDQFKTQMEQKMQFNFKSLRNVPAEMAGRLQQAMNYYTNLLKQYGFNEQNQAITVLFKDNQVGQLIGSQTALQLAMEDLTQVEKKKLDGVYNLPSNATAFIPLQAGQLLSEYTNNTVGPSNVNYGATSMTPPPVGSYPLGKPTTTPSDSEVIRQFMKMQQTELEKQAAALSSKYMTGPIMPTPFQNGQGPVPAWGTEPWYKTYGVNQPAARTPADAQRDSELSKMAETTVTGAEVLQNIGKQLYGTFSTLNKLFGSFGGGITNPLFGGTATKTAADVAPIKININQEKQTHEVTVQMTLLLDSRRLWDGMKTVALADYDRMTASVGDSQRSRGNVI